MARLLVLALFLVILTLLLWVVWGEAMIVRRRRQVPLDDRDLTRR